MAWRKLGAVFALGWALATGGGLARAATITITANTNWSAITTGTGTGGQPGPGDTIIVKAGRTLTVNVTNGRVGALQLGAGNPSGGQGTLTFSASTSQVLIQTATTPGNLTLGGGGNAGNLNMANGGTLTLGGFTSNTVGTFTRGSGTIVLTANNTLPTAAAYNTFNNLTVNGGTTTLGQNLTVAGNLNVASGSLSTSTRTLAVNGTMTVSGTATLTNTTTITGTTTIGGTLSITSATGNKTFVGDVTINPGGSWSNTVGGNIFIQGNFTNNGSFSSGTATHTFNGPAAQAFTGTSGGTTTFGLVTLNNANGLTLTGTHNITVTTLLTLTTGKITTGANTVYIANGSAISGVGTGDFIEGNLKKPFSIGSNVTRAFEVGGNSGNNYSPVSLTFASVTTGGDVTVSTTAGVHPQIASSGLDDGTPALLNRYWTITSGGVVFSNYAATFTYVSSEIDTGATASAFVANRYDGVNWNPTTLSSTPTTTSLSISGETGFGDIAIGNPVGAGGTLGRFNAYDPPPLTPSGSVNGNIRTKIAGTQFTLTIVHLNKSGTALANLNDTITVDLLDGSPTGGTITNNCSSNWTTVIATVGASMNGNNTTVNFTVSNAYPNVRVRVTRSGGSEIGCSNDNFAIRPESFTLEARDTDWQTAGLVRPLYDASGAPLAASGNNVHAASTAAATTPRPFTLRATTATSNYAGTLTVKSGPTCVLPSSCSTGSLDIGTWTGASGVLTATANYSEAGSFSVELEDATFADVDAADTALSVRSIPQRIPAGSLAALEIGRFVPDRFVFSGANTPVLQTFGSSCATRSFTYVGQPFWFVAGSAPSATLSAVNAAGTVTVNYALNTSASKPALTETFSDAGAPANAALNTAGVLAAGPFTGAGTTTYSPSGSLSYTRNATTAVGPFNAAISLSVTASDSTEAGVTISTASALTFNGGGSGIAFDAGTQLRYGIVRLKDVFAPLTGNASGNAPVAIEAQYWDGSAFATNAADNCTSFTEKNFVLDSQGGAITAANLPTPTAGSNGKVSMAAGTLVSGIGQVNVVSPTTPITAPGNVRICLDLDPASPQGDATCVAVTPSNRSYLQGRWAASGNYDKDPSARVGFGVYGAQPRNFIFFRENY